MGMYVDKSNADLGMYKKQGTKVTIYIYIWYRFIDFQLMVLILTYVKSTLSTSALSDENST